MVGGLNYKSKTFVFICFSKSDGMFVSIKRSFKLTTKFSVAFDVILIANSILVYPS